MTGMLAMTPAGLYCPAGGFHIDPWLPVERAVITHAHGDHAHAGSAHYLATTTCVPVLRARLPEGTSIEGIDYGAQRRIGDATLTLLPAGHVLGSAQARIGGRDGVTVVSGDYKLAPDPTCAPFEPVRCDTFVTESTFGLPIFRWQETQEVVRRMVAWWSANQQRGETSVVFVYALGKAQRLLAELARLAPLPGPIACHGALFRINEVYRATGIALPDCVAVRDEVARKDWSQHLVLAPPSARQSVWLRRFTPLRTAAASGWMALRGPRRRANLDTGFILSDHADWPALGTAIDATGASRVLVTHGYRDELVRWLREQRPDREAAPLETHFSGEAGAAETPLDTTAGSDGEASPILPGVHEGAGSAGETSQ